MTGSSTRPLFRPPTIKPRTIDPVQCEHDFKTYKQSIKVDNAKYMTDGPAAEQPYFVVRACPKCKRKVYVDMRR